jgi:hypothetical protein
LDHLNPATQSDKGLVPMIRPTGFSLVVFGQFDIVRIDEAFKRLEVILARGVEASGLAIRRLCLIEAEAIVAAEVEAEVIDLVLICVQLMFEIRII